MIETGLSSLLGSLADVYPDHRPQETSLPCIVYRRVSTTSDHTHDGPSNLKAVMMQFTAITSTHAAALTLAESIGSLLEVYSGVVGTSSVSFVQITNIVDLGHVPEADSWQVAVDAIFNEE